MGREQEGKRQRGRHRKTRKNSPVPRWASSCSSIAPSRFESSFRGQEQAVSPTETGVGGARGGPGCSSALGHQLAACWMALQAPTCPRSCAKLQLATPHLQTSAKNPQVATELYPIVTGTEHVAWLRGVQAEWPMWKVWKGAG